MNISPARCKQVQNNVPLNRNIWHAQHILPER
jgi:hypothetical protein